MGALSWSAGRVRVPQRGFYTCIRRFLVGFAAMPSPLSQTVALVPHPDIPAGAVRRIDVRIARMPEGMLATTYLIEGDIDRVRVPPPGAPHFADRLWQHTCCEIFIAGGATSAYHEFNFAPSGEWAAYAFERYRSRATLDDESETKTLDPQIAVRRDVGKLELNALILLGRLSAAHVHARLTLGLSAVIEEEDGKLSYWALKHPPGKPNFHHPDAFALALDEIRD